MTSFPHSTEPGPTDPPAPPGYREIEAAAARLEGLAVRTPLLESPALNARVGRRVLIKPEPLQRTGSFKFRGAYNRISLIPEAERARGVIAFSSGNHAQGVAAAAELLGVPATIVMPDDAPRIKTENTRGYGARVVPYRRGQEDREEVAAPIIAESGATLVRPYDDPGVIAGQGTCGREIALDAAERGLEIERLLICCGGGGLTAGCALAFEALSPRTRIHTVEPAGFDDTARSLAAGERRANPAATGTICDALMAQRPGELTFPINHRLVESGLTVTDDEVEAAMVYAFRSLKLVVEPGGAVALAALLSGKLPAEPAAPESANEARGCIAVVLSGGNVDPEAYAGILQRAGAGTAT